MEDAVKVLVNKNSVEARLGTKISSRNWSWIKHTVQVEIKEIMIDKIESLAEEIVLL